MAETSNDAGSYGLLIGFIYIFNLIVGSGALTMPKAFELSGIILSPVLLIFLTLMSFITATFMFEAMAITNAIKNSENNFEDDDDDNKLGIANPAVDYSNDPIRTQNSFINSQNIDDIINEDRPLVGENETIQNRSRYTLNDCVDDDYAMKRSRSLEFRQADKLFAIKQKFEMGEMAGLFFSKIGQLFFYFAMILYLYGDLAIYDAAVPKSLRDTSCTYYPEDNNKTLSEQDPCWKAISGLSRMNAYRIYVVIFNLLIGPLVFYNLQKTKFLQLVTTIMRWLAFITMISLAVIKITDNSSKAVVVKPTVFNIKGLPNFFGVCIYAFMCHHSLPSIITPIRNKAKFKHIIISAYLCIMVFYLLLSYTGIFAFGDHLEDFYTLNFLPDRTKNQSVFLKIVDYYLSLFPVFTISASFPIIGITLRNNLKSLYFFINKNENSLNESNRMINIGLPLITLIPPLIISLITHDLQLLVGITGSYAGVAIQYIIPSCLVYFGRRAAVRHFRKSYTHSFASPFKHKYWVFFVLLWANISVIFVTVNHVINKN